MDLTDIAINTLFTLIFGWSLVWTFFVWGFGIHNFTRKHGNALSVLGMLLWWVLMASHLVAIYAIWGTAYTIGQVAGGLLIYHTLYGLTFARDVSTG